MSATCIFCKIAKREIPSHIVHDDADTFAFMDIRPIQPGHVLVIPKVHVDHFSDLPDDAAVEAPISRIAAAVERVDDPEVARRKAEIAARSNGAGS